MDEEKSTKTDAFVTLTPKMVYGLRMKVYGNIHFSITGEVIYPVERVLVFHDFEKQKQRFLRFPEDTIPTIMTLNTHRRLLAVVEVTTISPTEKDTNICVYDTTLLLKRRNLQLPENAREKTISALSFVYDSRAVLVLTKGHGLDWMYMILFDFTATTLDIQVGIPHSRATAICVASNPQDINLIAVCGEGIMKLISRNEEGFAVSTSIKAAIPIRCIAWMSMEALMLGLRKNKLLLLENGEVKLSFRATETDVIDLSKDPDGDEDMTQEVPCANLETVSSMVCLSKIFAYAIGHEVYVFERVSKYKYQRLAIARLVRDVYAEDLYTITNMAINQAQNTIIVTCKHSQIYKASIAGLVVSEMATSLRFAPYGEFIHIDEIVDISICSWRSIIMTASKDQTIRIWNYETSKLEFMKRYQVQITVTELNQTGQFAAIGFSDQLRIMQIFLDDLNIIKTYNFPRCSQVKYSFYGHLMAAAYDNYVSITSVYNLDLIRTLKGHNGDVLCLAWSRDDKFLVSGGAEGAIYQWDVDTGARVQEYVQKGTEYRAIRCTKNPMTVFSVTYAGFFRQIANSEVLRDLTPPVKTPFRSMALARSDKIMYIATGGGHLFNVQLPFYDTGGGTFTNYRFFDCAVTKVNITYDDTLLIAGSAKGTLAIFILQNINGKTAPMDQDLLKGQEVLIPRLVLKEKIEQIANLELRIQQQAAEFQYQESQSEIFDSQQLADIHKGYCQALEALKNRNNELEQKHIEELNEITFRINDLKADQKRQMILLSEQFTERMLMEYQKFISFSQSTTEIRDGYEEELRKSAGYLQDTVEALEVDFKKQLEMREVLIRDLMKEIGDENYEYYEYSRQVAAENDANMMDAVIRYENIIKACQDEEMMWRGKFDVLRKKSDTLGKEAERLVEEVAVLHEEHSKSQRTIGKLMREIEDLRKDITDREFAISVKEKRIQEILHKNQELEKYKQVLSHTITDLKMQIEPLECQINEKRKQITDFETKLDNLNKTNQQLEVQLKSLSEKYTTSVAVLKVVRNNCRESRELISTICSDIYHTAGKISSPEKLKRGIKRLFNEYASDEGLKKHIILDEQVQAEFDRQRSHIENSIKTCKSTLTSRAQSSQSADLLKQNINLLAEIESLRKKSMNRSHELASLEAVLKIRKGGKTQDKLINTLQEIKDRRVQIAERLDALRMEVESLKTQNEDIQKELLNFIPK